MKKTLIAHMALTGVAMADTQVWDLSTSVTTGDYLYDATTGKFTDNTEVDGTVLNDWNGDGKNNGNNHVQTNICFTLNLTEAAKVTTETKLIDMDMGGDIGLSLTSTGLASTWGGTTSSSRQNVSYDTLLADTGVFTNTDGDKCITLTFVQTNGSGVQVWSNTTKHLNDTGLKSSSNKTLTSIYINGTYVEALQFAPGWEGDSIVNTNAAFNTAVVEKIGYVAVPEPTTATLSLLAFAGLAARRRRK